MKGCARVTMWRVRCAAVVCSMFLLNAEAEQRSAAVETLWSLAAVGAVWWHRAV